MRLRLFLLVFLLVGALAPLAPARALAQEDPVVIYVVRHAERADDGMGAATAMEDPPLSPAGQERSARLAGLLRDVGLTHVHSTDYDRTRSTAGPVSVATGVGVQIYDPSGLPILAELLRATPGIHLVVGHSNTNPDLVAALGGDPGEPIEPLEYDRIYVVHVLPSGATGSAVFRFGPGGE